MKRISMTEATKSATYRTVKLRALFNSRHYPELLADTAKNHLDASQLLLRARSAWRAGDAPAFLAGLSDVEDKVELRPGVDNVQPTNTGRQAGKGVEAEARFTPANHILRATYAYQDTDTTISDPFLGDISSPSERYPRLTAQLRWQYRFDRWGMPGIVLRSVSQRRSTVSNIRVNPRFGIAW